MKKIILSSISAMIIMLLCSCTRIVVNNSDEIKMNKWRFSSDNYESVSLTFDDDIASFKIESEDKTVSAKLKGLCVIDSDKMAIYNELDNENYVFKYKLKGEKLILEYMSGKITLLRVK